VVDELDLMAVFRLKAELTLFLTMHTQEIAKRPGKTISNINVSLR